MNTKEINEVKAQLWNHLQYLIGRIEELSREGRIVRDRDWLGEQYIFCKNEIEFWNNIS